MNITINNQSHSINEGTTLQDIAFAQVGEKQNGIAIAINQTVIQKQHWNTTTINPNDNVLIIKATQGG